MCLYFGELIQKVRLETIAMIMLSLSVVFTGIVVYQYGPYQASNTSYVNMTPIASFILDKAPQLYNPLHSTFSSRTIHVDWGQYFSDIPIFRNIYHWCIIHIAPIYVYSSATKS